MKRVISTILALVMVITVFSSLTLTASAIEDYERYTIQTDGFKNGEITFVICLNPGQTIYDAVVSVKYNKNVLAVVKEKTGQATTVDSDGNEADVVPGLHEHGTSIKDDSCYTFAYTTGAENGYKVGSKAKQMFKITFKCNGNSYSPVTLNFYAGDYSSTAVIKSFENIATHATPEITAKELKDGGIYFSWNKVEGVEGYIVFKKTATGFENVATLNPSTTYYTDSNVENGKNYTYGVASMDYIGYSSIYDTFDVTYRTPPKASASVVSTGIKVSWGKLSGADKYIVYRSAINSGTWSEWATVASVSSSLAYWNDTSVEKGVTYKYAVTAVFDDVETAYGLCSEIKYEPVVTSLATPTATIANTAQGIKITWGAVENAEKYVVYQRVYNKSTKKYSSWKAIKTTTETSYVDTSVKIGTGYSYAVRAVNGSVKSSYKATKGLTYNVTPTVKLSNASNGIKVTWTKAANATGYAVYSSTYNAKTKKWSGWSNRGTAKATATSWTDTKVQSGTIYKYTVRACNGSVKGNYNKNGISITRLAQPTTKIANTATGIKVSWNKVAGATGYRVYRSQLVEGKWTSWQTMGTAKSTASYWVDRNAVSGTTYRYTVRAVRGSVSSSYKATSSLMYLAQPTVTVKAQSNGFNVSWTESEGATNYVVYRSELNTKTKKFTSWKAMVTLDSENTTWLDTSAKKGVTYRYTVRAVNGNYKSTYSAGSSVKR